MRREIEYAFTRAVSFFSVSSFLCVFPILMCDKGNWRKFKDLRLRLTVGLACWSCSPDLKVSFIVAGKRVCSLILVAGQSPWGMNMRWECSGSCLSWMTVKCAQLIDRQQQAQWSALCWKKAMRCRLTDIRDLKHRLKWEAFSGPFVPADSAWVRGWVWVRGNGESCSIPAVFIALCLWEKSFQLCTEPRLCLFAASFCFSAQWPDQQPVSYMNTCWIHLLGSLCWTVSYLSLLPYQL